MRVSGLVHRCTAAQRARITTLRTERETLLLERNKIPLRVLKTRFKQCLADFRDDVWFSLSTFQGFDDIQQKLHSRDDFQAIWRTSGTVPGRTKKG